MTAEAIIPAALRDAEGPVFREPWEARAFAMAVSLNEAGLFNWPEWAEALGAELADADEPASDYYRCWLRALEKLIEAKAVAAPGALGDLAQDWLDAAARTPHGAPITLDAGRPQ